MIARLRTVHGFRVAVLVVSFVTVAPMLIAASIRADEVNPNSGVLIALDTATGREVWRAKTPAIYSIEDVSTGVVADEGMAATAARSRPLLSAPETDG